MTKLILLLLFMCQALNAHASTCGEIALAKRPLKYCYYAPQGPGSGPQTVIYYFHGLGGGPDDLFSADGKNILRGLQFAFGANQPIYVGLSVGNEGVIGPEAKDIATNGLAGVEQVIAPGRTVKRIAIGGSMGGHNSLRLAAEHAFKAVAAVCPALANLDGYDRKQVDEYEQRNAKWLNKDFFEKALVAYKKDLPNSEVWIANNPFTLLNEGLYDNTPIFLSVGREDTVGFIEGVREFAAKSSERPAMNLEVHEVTGPHCVFDVASFLRFVVRNAE